MYAFNYVPQTRTLEMRLEGRWTMEEFERFESAYNAAIREHARTHPIGLLSDSREFQVQAQDVAERFNAIGAGTGGRLAATAIVAATMLNKMQAERILPQANMKVFLDIKEARDWLADKVANAPA